MIKRTKIFLHGCLHHIIISLMIFIIQYAAVAQESGPEKVAVVYKIERASKTVIIASPRAGLILKMGDLVYITLNDRPVVMTVTFPMQTVAKCQVARSHEKYFDDIQKDMEVYRYRQGDSLQSLRKDFERLDEIRLYNGRIIQGAVISRGEKYIILTTDGAINVLEKDIKNIRILK